MRGTRCGYRLEHGIQDGHEAGGRKKTMLASEYGPIRSQEDQCRRRFCAQMSRPCSLIQPVITYAVGLVVVIKSQFSQRKTTQCCSYVWI